MLTASLHLCCLEHGPDSLVWEARSCEARILGFSSWARDISLRSVSLAFVSEAKNCFLGASTFDQVHQPSSAKLAEIEIFLIASAISFISLRQWSWKLDYFFDQFPQLSSMNPELGIFSEHHTSISFLSFRQWSQILKFFLELQPSISFINLRQQSWKLRFFS